VPPEHVAESQRWRLLRAAADALLASGYKGVTNRDISRRAGVSSSSFYEHFDNVDACLLAAHGMVVDCIWELVSAACTGTGSWPQRVRSALAAASDFLVAEPALARLLGADVVAGVPAIGAAHERLLARLAGLLCSGPALRRETADRLGTEAEIHLTAGAVALLSDRIVAGELDRLPGMNPELAELLSRPHLA
jgi:AcrR family transcriptional regulator